MAERSSGPGVPGTMRRRHPSHLLCPQLCKKKKTRGKIHAAGGGREFTHTAGRMVWRGEQGSGRSWTGQGRPLSSAFALKEACGASYNPSPGPRQTAGPQLHWAPKSMESRAGRGWKALLLCTRNWGEGCEGGANLAAVALRDLTGAWASVAMGGWGTQSLSTKAPTPFNPWQQ